MEFLSVSQNNCEYYFDYENYFKYLIEHKKIFSHDFLDKYIENHYFHDYYTVSLKFDSYERKKQHTTGFKSKLPFNKNNNFKI